MEGRTYLREALRGHADGGGGDEALEVGRGRRRRRRGGSVPPELRFRRRLRGQYKRSAAGEATPGTDMAGGQTGWACGRRARLLGRPRD
jgi:hypothetical protein